VHPPYANIISYSEKENNGDISAVESISEYVKEMKKVSKECYRVLKPGSFLAILVGDTRREKHHVPISFPVMQEFLHTGFILKEDVVKHQWNCKATGFWKQRSKEFNFLLLKYEHLFVFRKPREDEDLEKFEESMKWW